MPWPDNTRMRRVQLPSKTKGSESPLLFPLRKSGILSKIYLEITGTVAGSLSVENAFGFSSIVRRVRLNLNAGQEVFNFSGAAYHYMIRNFLDEHEDPLTGSDGRTAVTATTFDISMILPLAVNSRDQAGLIMLQSEQTEAVLEVEFEADATVATGATVTATVRPMLEIMSVPRDEKDWPDFDVLHTLIQETKVIAATGPFQYTPPRGNSYLGIYAMQGNAAASPADEIDDIKIRSGGSDIIEHINTMVQLNMLYGDSHGYARPLGVYPIDFMGSNGLGHYAGDRDILNSALITDLEVEYNMTATGNLDIVRRELVQIVGG